MSDLHFNFSFSPDKRCLIHDKMANKQATMSSQAVQNQKIYDLEERVHYLEDQNLTVRKALETALNQNKYLENRLENLGTNSTLISDQSLPFNFFLFFFYCFTIKIFLTQVRECWRLKTELRWGNHLKRTSWSCWNSTRTSRRGSQCWRPTIRRTW